MTTIVIRGRRIRVQVKPGTARKTLVDQYLGYSDERLDELEQESKEHESYTLGEVAKREQTSI